MYVFSTLLSGNSLKLWLREQTLKHVESAIHSANLPGISPQKHSSRILRIPISRPTSEVRAAIEKMIADQGEAAKIRLRSARVDALKAIVDKDGRKGKWGTEVGSQFLGTQVHIRTDYDIFHL